MYTQTHSTVKQKIVGFTVGLLIVLVGTGIRADDPGPPTEFNMHDVIGRLSDPGELFPAGLTGWQQAPLADGTPQWMIEASLVVYEVQPRKVSALVGLRRATGPELIMAMRKLYWLNRAVFKGDSYQAANKLLLDMVLSTRVNGAKIRKNLDGRILTIHIIDASIIFPGAGAILYTIKSQVQS